MQDDELLELCDEVLSIQAYDKRNKHVVDPFHENYVERAKTLGKYAREASAQRIKALLEDKRRLEEALPNGERLVQLAAWLDLKYPDNDNEVQEDLRRWGYGIQEALKEVDRDNPQGTCARQCEATAYAIKIRSLESTVTRLEGELADANHTRERG